VSGPTVAVYQSTVAVEALRYHPRYLDRLIKFAGGSKVYAPLGDEWAVAIYTPYGEVWCQPGDWVVRDRFGNLSVESAADFVDLYSPVPDLTGV
jgi:hypothetical protein